MPSGFFEAIVRPSIPPDTRPDPTQPPALADEDRLVTLVGQGARVLQYSHNFSYNFTKSKATEKKRTFDIARVHNPADSSQSVDVEVVHRLQMRDGLGNPMSRNYAKPRPRDNVTILEENQVRTRT